jgi:hypothetical protein
MASKRKRHKKPTLLDAPWPFIAGEWQSPMGNGVLIEDGKGNGVFVPDKMGTPLTIIPREAPAVLVPWENFDRIQARASIAAASVRGKVLWRRVEHLTPFFTDPIWWRLIEPLRGLA